MTDWDFVRTRIKSGRNDDVTVLTKWLYGGVLLYFQITLNCLECNCKAVGLNTQVLHIMLVCSVLSA